MKPYLIILTITLLLFSCSNQKTAVLWSSNKETAEIVELYNTGNSEYRIIFQYKENLVSSFIKADERPDIIIGEDLQNIQVKSELLSLENLYKKDFPKNGTINQALIGGVEFENSKHLLPLSYSLTAAVYNKNSKRVDSSLPTIELEKMKNDSISYNNEIKKRGFSPLWDENFIIALLDLFEASFSSSEEKMLTWNDQNIESALAFLKDWNELNGGLEQMSQFDDKFLFDNRIKILKEERILFSIMDSASFMELSDSMNKDIDFIYISHKFMIHPEKIVYGGINKKTSSYNASTDFLSWLTKAHTQEKIIQSLLKNKSGNFAILGGFSSINEVNEQILRRYYPRLAGKIPESQYIQMQNEKPVDFNSIKYELITSWVINSINGGEIKLDDALEKWEKLRIPF